MHLRQLCLNFTLASALYDAINNFDLRQLTFLLLKKKADPNIILPEYGLAPIHYASGMEPESFATDLLMVLLQCRGNPNLRSTDGMTPVLIASFWGKANVLSILLKNGGNPCLKDNEGKNAFQYAEEQGHLNVLKILKLFFSESHIFLNEGNISENYFGLEGDMSVGIDHEIYVSCENNGYENVFLNPKTIRIIRYHRSNTEIYSNFESNLWERLSLHDQTLPRSDLKIMNTRLWSDVESDVDGIELFNNELRKADDASHCESDLSCWSTSESVITKTDGSIYEDAEEGACLLEAKVNPHTICFSDVIFKNVSEENTYNDVSGNKAASEDILSGVIYKNFSKENTYNDDSSNKAASEDISKYERTNDSLKYFTSTSDKDDKTIDSVMFESSSSNASTIDTEVLREQYRVTNIPHGPITKTTKRVYCRYLKKINKIQCNDPNSTSFEPSEVLNRTFKVNLGDCINKWIYLEELLINDFLLNSAELRGGREKIFFNYLLLDPRITKELSVLNPSIFEAECWKIFLQSIFYVGKGKQNRPYAHLHEALQNKNFDNNKVKKIREIWDNKHGVICLHIFHSISSEEAFTREALIIDTINLNNLTNVKGGEYYRIACKWSLKQKCQLGVVILYRAFKIYLAEGERQIFPSDLHNHHAKQTVN